jgi:hypothetical protein
MNTTQTTATQTFDRMTGVAATDQRILEVTADWTADELFHWANSKDGRWFADMVFGCDDTFEHAARYIRKQPVR